MERKNNDEDWPKKEEDWYRGEYEPVSPIEFDLGNPEEALMQAIVRANHHFYVMSRNNPFFRFDAPFENFQMPIDPETERRADEMLAEQEDELRKELEKLMDSDHEEQLVVEEQDEEELDVDGLDVENEQETVQEVQTGIKNMTLEDPNMETTNAEQ